MKNTTSKGYVRLNFNGKWIYEHRLVARIAWGPRVRFPYKMQIHHMDGKRAHNCRENLLIIEPALHTANLNQKEKRQ